MTKKIFVVGGTGVIGKRLVPQLVQQGNQVTVLSRSKEKSKWITDQGATPLIVDIFDKNALLEKAIGYQIYIHCATSIPTNIRPKPKDWRLNARLRSEGVDNLVEVALKSKAELFIKESITFHYGDRNGQWVDESDGIITPIPKKVKINKELEDVILNNVIDMENKLLKSYHDHSLPVIILRFGWFYSYDSSNIEMISARKFPIIGKGNAYWNMLSVDDAAGAIIATIQNYKGNLGKIYNIVDNEPVLARDFVNYGTRLGSKKNPRKVPQFLAKLFVGSYIVNLVTSSLKINNGKAKKELNWQPIYPSYKEGLEHEIIKKS